MKSFHRVTDAFRSHGLNVRFVSDTKAHAQAPGHSDADESVYLTWQDGRTGIHCFSAPGTEKEILESVGLTWADRWDEPITTYRYPDGRNVVREPRKDRVSPKGKVSKAIRQDGNTKGSALYRADKIAALPPGTVVDLCEGEPDVHAALAAGAHATTNANGACNLHKADLTPLYGKVVRVHQDNDDAGRQRTAQAVELLSRHAEVIVVQAKAGNDLSDHLAAGYGLDELVPVDMPGAEPRLRVWKATELEAARRVEWLAKQRIVAGAVNYMLGPEGIGKSLFLVWLIALITTGKPFPAFGIPARDPRYVVLVLTEDDWSTIARPRLEVAGADLNYIRVICAERDGSGSPVFPRDMDLVEQAATDAAVVIVDAWADTLPGSLSVKDPQQARQALHPWKELGTRTGAAVLLSGHTNREKGGNVRNSYGLTGELRKKARLTILAQPDPEDETVMVIGPEKTNLAPQVPASKFRIESVPVFEPTEDSDGTVPRLMWIGDAEQSAREMFADAAESDMGEDGTDRGTAEEWLRRYLTDKPGADSAEVKKAAKAADIAERTLQRARKKLGIKPRLEGSPPRSYWELPSVPLQAHAPEGGTDGKDGKDAGQASVPSPQSGNYAICATPGEIGANAGADASVVTHVRPSAALRERAEALERFCPECGELLPAGIVRHLECVLAKTRRGA
ncbi:AAA family ATPase [Rhodococcus sp. AH-ZY2]|uniref:AAA family ATPase n=1 Tax=Rhodococcus sp. AH-ZY2 TaxID=3047468 RepID=UPI0027E1682F|nr:AAA family ATPase [Rhodococcus sp. AH-ZY2]WML64267.1 AAA family ATPase [Rhodococcus sp. AH-ZY2]